MKEVPTYEYQWLVMYRAGVVDTSAFYKTEEEMRNYYDGDDVDFFERLDKYKREVKY